MRQHLSHDQVSRYVDATPAELYDRVADVTRTPELTDDIVSCAWIDGSTGPEVGARFHAVNNGRGKPHWTNDPVVVVADPGREFAFTRTEIFAGTLQWRYSFAPEGSGTHVTESYVVVRPITLVGWFVIGMLYGHKDRGTELRASMATTLDRLAAVTATAPAAS